MPPRTEPISPRHLPIHGRRGFKSDATPTRLLKRIIQAGAIVGDQPSNKHTTRAPYAISWCERACQHPVEHPARMHYIELLLEAAEFHEFLRARALLEREVSVYEQSCFLERAAKEKSKVAVKEAVQEAAQRGKALTRKVERCRPVVPVSPTRCAFAFGVCLLVFGLSFRTCVLSRVEILQSYMHHV